jgi:hypothetical protein
MDPVPSPDRKRRRAHRQGRETERFFASLHSLPRRSVLEWNIICGVAAAMAQAVTTRRGIIVRRTLCFAVSAVLLAGAVWGATRAAYDSNYAQDRAEIDDLLARYLFALDWQDPEMYGNVFTEDGVLVWAGGTVNGRQAIVQEMRNAKAADDRANAATPTLRPFKRRHFISNFTVRIEGDRATARSLWFELNNDGADRRPYVGAYGHLNEELRRVNGRWLIARHQVFNEQRENMAAGSANPAW